MLIDMPNPPESGGPDTQRKVALMEQSGEH